MPIVRIEDQPRRPDAPRDNPMANRTGHQERTKAADPNSKTQRRKRAGKRVIGHCNPKKRKGGGLNSRWGGVKTGIPGDHSGCLKRGE